MVHTASIQSRIDDRSYGLPDRLSFEEMAEHLAVFWDMIDTEINEGDIPPWN